MTGMNRLSPLIVRRVGPCLTDTGSGTMRGMVGSAAAMALTRTDPFAGAEPAKWLEDLKLFATGWIGGLIFFGTLFG